MTKSKLLHPKINAISTENPLRPEDFPRFISNAIGLFWRMKISERKIEFLNPGAISSLPEKINIGRLLQDLVWAQDIVLKEDFFRFKLFIIAMREGKEASVIFRIAGEQNKQPPGHDWLRIAGAPGIDDPTVYYGYIRDATKDVNFIHNLFEKDLERQTMIESENLPVMLVDMDTGAVISRNILAYELFGYTYEEFLSINFQALYPGEQKSYVAKIFKTCISEGYWEGSLPLVKKGDIPIQAFIKLKRLSLRSRNILKISIDQHSGDARKKMTVIQQAPDREQFKQSLVTAMSEKHNMADILDTLLGFQYGGSFFDAVMYADVYVKKRKVVVYARGKDGEVFANLKPGTTFNFEGTISQAIWENKLDFLILGDTLESTKPIDWALFIPHGVRSYFVKPFFHGDQLRTLLLFCSTQPNRFSEKDMEIYELYYPAFLKGLKNWRKTK
jgi:hypothetical protein